MAPPIIRQDGTIKTRRLLLRAAQESDLPSLHQLFSDEEVMRYWSCAPSTSIHQTSTILQKMLASPTNGVLDFVIVLLPSSPSTPSPARIIGKAGIWRTCNSELGFMLSRSEWGKGYMAEALTALLGEPDGVFWKRGVERVLADVDPRNVGSIGILRRFGFEEVGREEGTFETHLGWCDSVYFELRRGVGMEGDGGMRF